MSDRRAVLHATPPPATGLPGVAVSQRRAGLRLRPARPGRVAAAVLLLVGSVVAALTVYVRIGDRHDVLMLTRDVLAGAQLQPGDIATVAISADDGLRVVAAASAPVVVGQYAKVRMLAGSLLAADSLQPGPLVDPGKAVMSVPVPASATPSGLREGSRLLLTVTPPSPGAAPVLVEAFAVAPARFDGGATAGSVVVQVPLGAVVLVATGKVVVAVIDPTAVLPAGVVR